MSGPSQKEAAGQRRAGAQVGQAARAVGKDPVGAAKRAASEAVRPVRESYRSGGADEAAGRLPEVAAGVAGGKGLGSVKAAGKQGVTAPYKRPSGATTQQQRQAVQGKPCVDCGRMSPSQHADHKKPLVKEHYETGKIDKQRMRSQDAVQPQCPTCSNAQGGRLSAYSRMMKRVFGFE